MRICEDRGLGTLQPRPASDSVGFSTVRASAAVPLARAGCRLGLHQRLQGGPRSSVLGLPERAESKEDGKAKQACWMAMHFVPRGPLVWMPELHLAHLRNTVSFSHHQLMNDCRQAFPKLASALSFFFGCPPVAAHMLGTWLSLPSGAAGCKEDARMRSKVASCFSWGDRRATLNPKP